MTSARTKVCVRPTATIMSRAMFRVAAALAAHAPKDIEIVDDPTTADVQVLHVIGFDGLAELKAPQHAVIQYCGSTMADHPEWQDIWRGARMVWSYYDLERHMPPGVRFLLAPLGIDPMFAKRANQEPPSRKSLKIITSGYSTAPMQEPIQEVALAVDRVQGQMVHLGPKEIEGWVGEYPTCFQTQFNIPDQTLATLYASSERVSGFRHGEGFELSVIEGLVCGARPVVFDRPDMRMWYEGLAEFVPVCSGVELTERLVNLFKSPLASPTLAERQHVAATFNWHQIVAAFWDTFAAGAPARVHSVSASTKRRILVIGDAGVSTGFARATHKMCDVVDESYEVHIIALNHNGDPITNCSYGDRIYPAMAGGDGLGVNRVREMVERLGPAAIVIQNDPWNFPHYLKHTGNVPTIGWVAVDGENINGRHLTGLSKAVFWTQFGMQQAQAGGWSGRSSVVPLGVDLDVYKPLDRAEERERVLGAWFRERGLPPNTFVVGAVGRNQWRKRLDLTIEYFAKWIQQTGVNDACLWLQSAPTGDDAWDLADLCKYWGVADRVIVPKVDGRHGMTEAALCRVYNILDVLLVTSLGEGFHLPSFEAMACGTPVVAADWSGLGELLKGSQTLVPCTGFAAHPRSVNTTIGGVMDREMAIGALAAFYGSPALRAQSSKNALITAGAPRYRWRVIGEAMLAEIDAVLSRTVPSLKEDLVGV